MNDMFAIAEIHAQASVRKKHQDCEIRQDQTGLQNKQNENTANMQTAGNEVRARIWDAVSPESTRKTKKLECGPMRNVMAALSNIGGARCSTPQRLAHAHYWSAVQ